MFLRVIISIIWVFEVACHTVQPEASPVGQKASIPSTEIVDPKDETHTRFLVRRDVRMDTYFESLDSICAEIDTLFHVSLNEYELVHANMWMLDSLVAQDYYIAQDHGIFILDQRQCVILKRGDSLHIPSQVEIDSIDDMLRRVYVDVNIPEFRLRIVMDDQVIHLCPIRVGKNERAFLATAGHEVDLRTPVGEGSIIRIERDPLYMNPVDGHRYTRTRRDDGRYTKLPRIPFLEPIIDGRRTGTLLHPTTNRSTLGKAVSNGCVGMSEADAWRVYYYAPLGTRVIFRYDLDTGRQGELRDIYKEKME